MIVCRGITVSQDCGLCKGICFVVDLILELCSVPGLATGTYSGLVLWLCQCKRVSVGSREGTSSIAVALEGETGAVVFQVLN